MWWNVYYTDLRLLLWGALGSVHLVAFSLLYYLRFSALPTKEFYSGIGTGLYNDRQELVTEGGRQTLSYPKICNRLHIRCHLKSSNRVSTLRDSM